MGTGGCAERGKQLGTVGGGLGVESGQQVRCEPDSASELLCILRELTQSL